MEEIAKELHKTVNCLTVVWTAADFGTVATHSLYTDKGEEAWLPDNAIVFLTIIDNVTLPVSASNNGTLAIQSESAGDILATVDPDATNWTEGLPLVGANIPLIASKTTIIKMTAARRVKAVVATNAFSAGEVRFHILYVLGA
jgi:hypothetical protein